MSVVVKSGFESQYLTFGPDDDNPDELNMKRDTVHSIFSEACRTSWQVFSTVDIDNCKRTCDNLKRILHMHDLDLINIHTHLLQRPLFCRLSPKKFSEIELSDEVLTVHEFEQYVIIECGYFETSHIICARTLVDANMMARLDWYYGNQMVMRWMSDKKGQKKMLNKRKNYEHRLFMNVLKLMINHALLRLSDKMKLAHEINRIIIEKFKDKQGLTRYLSHVLRYRHMQDEASYWWFESNMCRLGVRVRMYVEVLRIISMFLIVNSKGYYRGVFATNFSEFLGFECENDKRYVCVSLRVIWLIRLIVWIVWLIRF